jgi:hypothetical protein
MAMQRVGDDSAGFSVDRDSPDRVHVKAWGFWSAEVASIFEPTVASACSGRPKGGVLHLDMTSVKPMRDEGQQAVMRLLRALPSLGIARAVIAVTNPLAKLQLVRLATESRTAATVEWVTAATDVARGV